MSEVVSRIPVDRTSGKYKRDWHATQGEQVSPAVFRLTPISYEFRTPMMTACAEP